MAHVDFLASEITKRYGAVTRARGCFLYTRKGVRLTDLYQEGGRAILGWGGSPFTVFKNVLNRGIVGSFNTDYSTRVSKAVQDLLGMSCAVFVFTEKTAAIRTALAFSKDGTQFWKPWRDASASGCGAASGHISPSENISASAGGATCERTSGCVIIEPPLPWTAQIFILAISQEIYEAHLASGYSVPDSTRIPAPLSAAVARAIYDMIAEIPRRTEKNWFIYDKIITKYWKRNGPYLFPKIPAENYNDFICHCLDCGIVISPDYNTPSIVPFGADLGVFGKLKNNPFLCGGIE